jgi:hypothetical protein
VNFHDYCNFDSCRRAYHAISGIFDTETRAEGTQEAMNFVVAFS